MRHEVQLSKRFPLHILQSQIDKVKDEKITYSITERTNFYALDIKYDTTRTYTAFMERLHDLWKTLK